MLLSERLAAAAPKLTLDFLSEACLVFSKCSTSQRMACLQYMSPWIKNLPLFCNPTNSLFEQSGARLRDCVKLLLEITMHDKEVRSNFACLRSLLERIGLRNDSKICLGGSRET